MGGRGMGGREWGDGESGNGEWGDGEWGDGEWGTERMVGRGGEGGNGRPQLCSLYNIYF